MRPIGVSDAYDTGFGLEILVNLFAKDLLTHTYIACVICYNDYNTESPEGIKEQPLRLPKCKHIFGSHCIQKWFEESDSCPYCRDRLLVRQVRTKGQPFMNMMRVRHWSGHGG